ncbi:MAG: AMP phosphorylase, partial [Nanoarchaeota archaeon]|nr:AMP phosphorylase [Nanoarchaeota archaeon]
KKVVVIIDISVSGCFVPKGTIGLFDDVMTRLKTKNGQEVKISIVNHPESLSYIKKKMDGHKLSKKEINQIIADIVTNTLTEFEVAFFVAASYMNPLDENETLALTNAMVNSGKKISFKKKIIMDKHCIGGVAGNRTTMIVVPIIAAAGLTIPKTSSRSITSPAGTSDTVEVLCGVCFDHEKVKKIVEKTNGCLIWGGSLSLAPADDIIIRIEHPFDLDARSQMLASILAKKASVNATDVLIDIPYGKGAKIEEKKKADELKRDFESMGKKLGINIKAIFTDGSQPIGYGFGPVLEAKDVLYVLRNDPMQPMDLRKKSIKLAGIMLEMGKKSKRGEGEKLAKEILDNGKAYSKFIEIIKAQGGKEVIPEDLKAGSHKKDIKAWKDGKISYVGNKEICRIARIAGAPVDKSAGVLLHKKKGTYVNKGEVIMTIYAESKDKLKFAVDTYNQIKGILIK